MNAVELRPSPVSRQLEAYEEGWKKDHDAARERWAAEDTVTVGISTALLLERVHRAWRERIFRGIEPYREEDNQDHRSLFGVWLRVTESLLEAVSRLEQDNGPVEGAEELRAAAQRIRSYLDAPPPQLSRAVGLREMTLSQEAEAELQAILQRPAPPLPVSGVRLTDPAEFPRK